VTIGRAEKTIYKTIRVKDPTHKDLIKFRNLYSLQDGKDYSLDDTINLLISDRISKQFILPITKDKKEAVDFLKQS